MWTWLKWTQIIVALNRMIIYPIPISHKPEAIAAVA